MSQFCNEKIICPECNSEGEFDYWTSINIDLNPELKERLFNEELFIWTCPECGTKVYVPFGTLYHDMNHRFMIFYTPNKPEDRDKYEPVDIPHAFGIDKEYTLRVVYGITNLKEKILILENGLNDIAIEKLKYTIRHHLNPDLLKNGIELYFHEVTKANEDKKYGELVFYFYCPSSNQDGVVRYDMQRYYEQCLSLDIDSRFHVNSCTCVDEEWISMKMKGVE